MSTPSQNSQRTQARLASIVVLVAMVGWMFVSWLGGYLGLPVKYVFLADLCALAAFAWAGIVLFRIWRNRQVVGEK